MRHSITVGRYSQIRIISPTAAPLACVPVPHVAVVLPAVQIVALAPVNAAKLVQTLHMAGDSTSKDRQRCHCMTLNSLRTPLVTVATCTSNRASHTPALLAARALLASTSTTTFAAQLQRTRRSEGKRQHAHLTVPPRRTIVLCATSRRPTASLTAQLASTWPDRPSWHVLSQRRAMMWNWALS